MIPGTSMFNDLPTPIKAGVYLASGGGIMGALFYVIPARALWVVFIGVALLALLVVLYFWALKRWKKRKAAPMERGVIESTSTTPQGVSDASQMARLDDLRKKFEDGIAKFHAAGKSLYNFPWYMIVGEPGSGKTEAIRHCNIGFPPGLQDQFQGAGGTLNMNWWFTDHAVIVDTAGRLMFDEVDTGGSGEWKEFLKLLKRNRPRCPINGVFLVIPADSLIRDTADQIEQKASKIARQFDVIQRTLDVRFPVFVVVTKSDLLNGFRDFFENLHDPQLQHQILGWSNPAPLDEPYNPDFIDQHLKTIRGRLFRRRLALLQDVMAEEPGGEKAQSADTLYAFPQSLVRIAPRMARYLELIFSVGSQWSCKPLFFRGIYFTSSMREGSALDEDLADSLGVPVDSLPDGRVWERDRAYFLRDLFVKKVFREDGLVTHASNAKKLRTRRNLMILASALASVVLFFCLTIYAAVSFNRSIGKVEAYLGDSAKLLDSGQGGELEVIQHEYADTYSYMGRARVSGVPADVNRVDFSAQLADTIAQWETKGVPSVFWLAEKFARRIDQKEIRRAQAVIYEAGVLRPFLDAARGILGGQKNGDWRPLNPETLALRQLIRVEAGKPLGGDDVYSAEALLDPLFVYIFQAEEGQADEVELVEAANERYKTDRARLHRPMHMIYDQAWPPGTLTGDPNARAAIENGVDLFNRYWAEPNRVGASGVTTIRDIKAALASFDAAEESLLSIPDRFAVAPENVLQDAKWSGLAKDWNENFARMRDAVESIDRYVSKNKTRSLADLWAEEARKALTDVNQSYEFLLTELKDVKNGSFLGGVRQRLDEARMLRVTTLSSGDFAKELDRFDREFWAARDGRRLYEIRFEMYSRANEQLDGRADAGGLGRVAGQIRKVEAATRQLHGQIEKLLNVARTEYRLDKASKVSGLILDLSGQRLLYHIVKEALESAPKTKVGLEELIAGQPPGDGWEAVPPDIRDRKFDPNGAAAMLGGWKLIADVLGSEEYKLPEAASLNGIYADANDVYADYPGLWLDYWLDKVPDYIVKNRARADSERFTGLIIRNVFDELLTGVGEVLEGVLSQLGENLPAGNPQVVRFRASLDRIRDRRKYEKIYEECRDVLNNWRELSDDMSRARHKLLGMLPGAFREDYVPFTYESPADFVGMYWTELTSNLLRVRAREVQEEGKKAFDDLGSQYGSKFPLERDSETDLTEAELVRALSLLDQILASNYDAKMIGGEASTGQPVIDGLLGQLREIPLSESDKAWLKAVRGLAGGLATGPDPYYCRINLLGEREQRGLLAAGEDLLLDYLTALRVVQGSHSSARFNTRSASDSVLDVLRYPGSPVNIEFYQYPSDTAAHTSLPFRGPWGCLRMLRDYHYSGKPGYIKLKIDKGERGLGGVLFLRLEFCRDGDCNSQASLPRPEDWPSQKNKR